MPFLLLVRFRVESDDTIFLSQYVRVRDETHEAHEDKAFHLSSPNLYLVVYFLLKNELIFKQTLNPRY
jgi:hypothetical protein